MSRGAHLRPRHRSPAPRPVAQVRSAALAVVLPVLLTGCATEDTGPVEVPGAPTVNGPRQEACRGLVAALPERLADQPRRPVATDAPAAAWGDPPIVLTCGGTMPSGYDRFSACQEVDGVGWFIPRSALRDPAQEDADDAGPVPMTTIEHRPVVRVELPAEYRPPATAMTELAPAIRSRLTVRQPCR